MAGLTPAAALLAAVADMLPLTHGIYVRDGVPCVGASNVDTYSYWGRDGGLNSQAADCHVTRRDQVGATYRLAVSCNDSREGGTFHAVQTLKVEGRTAFHLYGEGRTSVRYRYCGPRVQF